MRKRKIVLLNLAVDFLHGILYNILYKTQKEIILWNATPHYPN